ncbi:MAG: hypothetical protein FWE36_02215 [Erysipelotrichales bacterium]|nr:hypothetical protein [Erysipelotrichales bacterium]
MNQKTSRKTAVHRERQTSIEETEIKDENEKIVLDQDFLRTMIISQAIATPKGKSGNKNIR